MHHPSGMDCCSSCVAANTCDVTRHSDTISLMCDPGRTFVQVCLLHCISEHGCVHLDARCDVGVLWVPERSLQMFEELEVTGGQKPASLLTLTVPCQKHVGTRPLNLCLARQTRMSMGILTPQDTHLACATACVVPFKRGSACSLH